MKDRYRSGAIRHRLPDRLFHWTMAVAVIVLGGSAFLPIIGIRFDWVPIHWWTGLGLILTMLYHFWRVGAVHGLAGMTPGPDDVREIGRDLRGADLAGLSTAKYDAFQKAYHLAASVTVLTLIGTGIVMLAKIDTFAWRRDPSILSDQTWGIIYVIHGAAALVMLFLFILHVYFALLPEHRAYLIAMLRGRGPENARGQDHG